MGSTGRPRVRAVQQTSQPSGNRLQDFQGMSTQDASNLVGGLQKSTKDGTNPNNALQSLTNELDLNDKPLVLDDKVFDARRKTDALDGVVLHRGFGYQRDDTVLNSIKFGDVTYQGDGIHGNGTYLTTKKSYAKGYSGGDAKFSTFTAYIDKNKASVITENALRRMFARESLAVQRNFRGFRNDDDDGISTYALHKGYNVISVPGGNGNKTYNGDFYVALTRDVLVIRNNTKIK